jgi:hypothetical protein
MDASESSESVSDSRASRCLGFADDASAAARKSAAESAAIIGRLLPSGSDASDRAQNRKCRNLRMHVTRPEGLHYRDEVPQRSPPSVRSKPTRNTAHRTHTQPVLTYKHTARQHAHTDALAHARAKEQATHSDSGRVSRAHGRGRRRADHRRTGSMECNTLQHGMQHVATLQQGG